MVSPAWTRITASCFCARSHFLLAVLPCPSLLSLGCLGFVTPGCLGFVTPGCPQCEMLSLPESEGAGGWRRIALFFPPYLQSPDTFFLCSTLWHAFSMCVAASLMKCRVVFLRLRYLDLSCTLILMGDTENTQGFTEQTKNHARLIKHYTHLTCFTCLCCYFCSSCCPRRS